ncbi:MAG: flagellar export protein FliJ [Pseudomonadota bacterium]
MPKPSVRIRPIQRIAEKKEENAARALGDAQRALQAAQTRLNDLKNYYEIYQRQFQAAAAVGISTTQLQGYFAFLSRLDEAIQQQHQAVQDSEAERQRQMEIWKGHHSYRQSIDHLVERLRHEEFKADERREQKESDEFGSRNAQRQTDENS